MITPETTQVDKKQGKSGLHWAPKLIAAVFVLLLTAMIAFILIASRGLPSQLTGWLLPNQGGDRLHTAFPGVIPHDQNSLYEPHMKKMAEQRNLGWHVEISGLDGLAAEAPGTITVRVQDSQGQALPAERVEVSSWRVANSNDDHHLLLQAQGGGEFLGAIRFPAGGRWLIGVTVTRGTDVYTVQRNLIIATPAKN